jgi:two-component system, OmpR family, KDP operon response regulator KdpE
MAHQELLVVDDDAGMRKLLSQNLRAAGYDILQAADGSEAMKIVSERSVAMVLLDIGLPGPDGLAVLEAVRRDKDVPVLMISARGRETDRARALDLGADDYLTKPFGATEFLARVRALLRRATAGSRNPRDAYRYAGLEVDFGARRARLNGASIP